ncbi:NAD-dependent epimerase/dehydratase family protein [Sorangium sp. So ce406]|uniref:NAD-dependent epimerase/dehydratase family protein n=1 Tax=Sorangium sp. So ce406 TaxID=3133311 RepID=UPI003F5B459F
MSERTPGRGRRPGADSDPSLRPILITGICGRLGRRLARRLHRDQRVIGVDRRSFDGRPKDIEHHQIDIRRKKTQDIFRQEQLAAVVHLGVMHDPRVSQMEHHSWNLAGFQRLLEFVAQYDVPKLIVLSSANAYGPRPDNAQFLTEDAPLLGGASFSEIRDLIEVDMLAQSFFWKHPQTETVILRPVHILGSVRNAPSNYLRLNVIPTLLGFDPMVQVIHQDDVVSAIVAALRPGVRGIFNLAGPPPLPLSRVIEMTGRTRATIPHFVMQTIIPRLWRFRATSFPAPELDHIRYVCMVDDRRAREILGYTHGHDIQETVHAVDDIT